LPPHSTPTFTSRPSSTPIPSDTLSPTSTATSTASPVPSATPLPACVTLIYEGYAQFEIIAPTGQRVLVDVYDPQKLSRPADSADILLTTHTHWDHVNDEFVAAFPGEQIFVREGELQTEAVRILGIASAHNAGDARKPEGGTNYIFRIDIGGLRIVHFGDTGQNAFTETQLDAFGAVDIAISQINNPYSEMDAQNGKGIRLMEQVNPRLVIPTHLNLDTVKLAISRWPPGFYAPDTTLKICADDLGEGTQFLLMGEAVETMRRYVDLEEWGSSQ
jgi:L-ascorbate metabolism protein UlaG (beta-lactamase superfamily)